MMTGVLDNLASINQVLGTQMPVIGPAVLARSAIEIGIGSLVADGAGHRRPARACRELALSLESARRAKQIAKEFQEQALQVGLVPQDVTVALRQEASVLQRITALGITPPEAKGLSPKIENEKAEDATKATAAMLKAVLPRSVPGTYVYRTYSAITHGAIYGLMSLWNPGPRPTGPRVRFEHPRPGSGPRRPR
jgi:hypothetical protein